MNIIFLFPLIVLILWFVLARNSKSKSFSVNKDFGLEQSRHEYRKAAKLYR